MTPWLGEMRLRMILTSSILLSIPLLSWLSDKSMIPTVMFSRSRCLLWTVSHSLRIFSLILFMSFSFSSLAEEASCSNSKSRIIRSRLALSKSMFKRSLLRMYIRAAVQRDKFLGWERKEKKSLVIMLGRPFTKFNKQADDLQKKKPDKSQSTPAFAWAFTVVHRLLLARY